MKQNLIKFENFEQCNFWINVYIQFSNTVPVYN